jgi:excisionase family DNA binding protein
MSESPLLRTPEAADYLTIAGSTLEKLRLYGRGPRFVRVGTRAIRYRREDLDAWLTECARRSTSELGSEVR